MKSKVRVKKKSEDIVLDKKTEEVHHYAEAKMSNQYPRFVYFGWRHFRELEGH